MSSLHARVAALEASGEPFVLVTVVEVSGSTPRAPGARMIVHADGRTEGTIGGGRIEHEATALALEVLADGAPRTLERALTQELGMCCGGSMRLFLEPLGAAPPLLIFGAGHVGAALSRVATAAGFRVSVADEREALLHGGGVAEAGRRFDDLEDPALPFGPETFVVITTHDHALDQRLLERALRRPHRWVGVIGSRRKAELTRQRLEHRGFEPELVAKVRIPIGLAIGAETPEEIAISILAELIAARRGVTLSPAAPSLETKVGR